MSLSENSYCFFRVSGSRIASHQVVIFSRSRLSNSLNPQQREAAHHIGSPLLVLAGAGSGKTRVITYKIAWLLDKQKMSARNIFAVTFTNKAAREMKERVTELLGENSEVNAKGLTVSTFHSLGMQILREDIEACGRKNGFSIFDPQDSLMVVRELMRSDKDEDGLVERVRSQISSWKNQLINPQQAEQSAMTNATQVAAAKIYQEYERYLQACNAVDLDDLIYLPNILFAKFANILLKWQQRVQYLLVDEYQDTNASQYQLVKYLVGDTGGLTAVGDDDQSIYAWRGAQPENLVQLQTDFPDLKLVKLEQNYRSMGRILELANHLIANNPRPFEKRLWSELGYGEPIQIIHAKDDEHEAEKVVAGIMQHKFRQQTEYGDYAILYRGNHQSRVLEQKLREMHIPYYLSGGLSFFERSEIKDLMAYMRLITNHDDDNAFVRAINTPRRGIGAGALEKLGEIAAEQGFSLFAAASSEHIHNKLSPKQQAPVNQFIHWLEGISERIEFSNPIEMIRDILDDIDYRLWVEKQSASPEQAEARWNNVEDLIKWVGKIVQNDPQKDLTDVVATISLMGILERNEDDENKNVVSLMTMHAAKGLEFPYVYIVGVEEEILPHRTSIEDDMVEEERRLFYVGITRAQRDLTLSFANARKRYGEIIDCLPSRFIDELDKQHVVWEEELNQSPEQQEATSSAHLEAMRAMLK